MATKIPDICPKCEAPLTFEDQDPLIVRLNKIRHEEWSGALVETGRLDVMKDYQDSDGELYGLVVSCRYCERVFPGVQETDIEWG